MKTNPAITQSEMAEYFSLSVKTIEKNIKILKEQNIIRREGPDKGGYWVVINK
ncbi:hypothetical protein FACS1894123_09440 [Bacteroidia bacterium]|nr:hypothetical protein FACS1894123_09440 [Bacteroidia bacterium]